MSVIQKKVCLLGEFAVGKTSLIRRFVEGKFEEKYLSTIGVAVSRKSVQLDDYTVKLLIWDLAGGDDYTNSSYLLGAAGGIIVCDLTRIDTLNALTIYHRQLRLANPKAQIVLIANKVDLEAKRAISDEDLTAVANLVLYVAAGALFPEVMAWPGAGMGQVVGASFGYLCFGTIIFGLIIRFSSRPTQHYWIVATLGMLLSLWMPISAGLGYGAPGMPIAGVSTVVTLCLMHIISYAISTPLYIRQILS